MDDELKTMIRDIFHISIVNIIFEKVDGSLREMNATLNFDYIPEEKRPKGNTDNSMKEQEQTLRVFDTDKNDWRSFRWDSLKTIKVYKGDREETILDIGEQDPTHIGTRSFWCGLDDLVPTGT